MYLGTFLIVVGITGIYYCVKSLCKNEHNWGDKFFEQLEKEKNDGRKG